MTINSRALPAWEPQPGNCRAPTGDVQPGTTAQPKGRRPGSCRADLGTVVQPGTRSLGNPIVARTTQPPPTHLALLAKPATLQLWYPFAGRTTLLALRANANNFASWSMLLRHSHFLHCGNAGNFAATLQPWQSLCWSHHPHSLRCGHAFGSPLLPAPTRTSCLRQCQQPSPPHGCPRRPRFLHCWQCQRCNFGNPPVHRTTRASCIVGNVGTAPAMPLLATPPALLALLPRTGLATLAIPLLTALPTRLALFGKAGNSAAPGIHCWPHHSHFLD